MVFFVCNCSAPVPSLFPCRSSAPHVKWSVPLSWTVFSSFSSVSFSSPSYIFSSLLSRLAEALSVLQGLTDIHTDANDTTGFEALHSALSPLASLSLSVPPFLILATFSLVLSSWAIRQREKSQLAHGGNQTSFSCPFNTGINFLQG